MIPYESVPRLRGAVKLVDDLRFPESPRWHDGRLYFSDMYDKQVLALSDDGRLDVVCRVPGEPSGLGWTVEGDLLVVSMQERQILRLHDHRLEVYADLSAYVESDCNDMHVDASGRAWVGSFGFSFPFRDGDPAIATSLLRVEPDGRICRAVDELIFPNGIEISADGTLYVAETWAFRISTFALGSGGSIAERKTLVKFREAPIAYSGDVHRATAFAPDGICLDAAGSLWVGSATGGGPILVSSTGEIIATVDLGDLTAFAVCLGGPDGRTLYMCAGPPMGEADHRQGRQGSIWAVRVDEEIAICT